MNHDSSPEPNLANPQPETADVSEAHKPVEVIEQQFTSPNILEAQDASASRAQTTARNDELAEFANAPSLAVVKTLSVRGLEYLFMSICLWIGATSLIWGLLLLVNGAASAQMLAFPATSLVVCLPVFAWFFIRLKKAELEDPTLRFDSSKRRLSQITQIVAFLTTLFNVITFVYLVIASLSGGAKVSIGKAFLNLLVILAVSGGILAYYWIDEHRSFKG
jgi:hypothetical protein